MTDKEITKLCAKAMGFELFYPLSKESPMVRHESWYDRDSSDEKGALKLYAPLEDNEQAMALVKRFQLSIQAPQFVKPPRWHVWRHPKPNHTGIADVLDLNRAICECVAKMQVDVSA